MTSPSTLHTPAGVSSTPRGHGTPTGPVPLRRRDLLAAALLAASPLAYAAPLTSIEIWKGPTCGCCGDWTKHLEANGFKAKTFATGNSDQRKALGMPVQLGSCHTALVEGYAIEGHVPAPDIRRLLRERPQAVGLAVPGMPIGSPGMDGPTYGGQRDAYAVLLVQRDGSTTVFHDYR